MPWTASPEQVQVARWSLVTPATVCCHTMGTLSLVSSTARLTIYKYKQNNTPGSWHGLIPEPLV